MTLIARLVQFQVVCLKRSIVIRLYTNITTLYRIACISWDNQISSDACTVTRRCPIFYDTILTHVTNAANYVYVFLLKFGLSQWINNKLCFLHHQLSIQPTFLKCLSNMTLPCEYYDREHANMIDWPSIMAIATSQFPFNMMYANYDNRYTHNIPRQINIVKSASIAFAYLYS